MKPFLEELAEKIIAQHKLLEEITVVFPNRRAALFFRNYLAAHILSPVWSPRLITIEELFKELSDIQEADRLSLIFRLFHVYRGVMKKEESFDRFYFWGDMLLRDFDEVDKYRAPATQLFKDLSSWREFDDTFDALTEEQKKFLKDFWLNFGEKPANSKEEFLRIWRQLPKVYELFVQSLRNEGIGYEGMIHRDVADKILSGKLKQWQNKKTKKLAAPTTAENMVFAGFNALTAAEEILIRHFSEQGASVHWDLDPWYVENKDQEAGQFFRQYKRDKILGPTFETVTHSNFSLLERKVDLYGVPQKAGQAKLLGQILENEVIPELQKLKDIDGESKTVIVLPDETLLLSVLHSLPEALKNINVTMGYPLRSTPVYNLLELLIDLQTHRKENTFSHRQVTAILAHPYVVSQEDISATHLRMDIIKKNRIYIPAAELQQQNTLLSLLFRPVTADDITDYLLEIIRELGNKFNDDRGFDREYAFHFYSTLARFSDILKDSGSQLDLRGFQKLFRQVIQAQKIPFTGEPLKGLQIMGVLETRNLDFDNVFILSLNEGSLPAAPRQGSYIPHAIRKAYGLPTHDHQDAMYAYLFYRLLQRAKNVRLFYNTEPDILGMGEMSRFVQQLIHESGWKINRHVLSNPIQLGDVHAITVAKTPEVLKSLSQYTDPEGKGISPSALNDYVECRLRFYLKHVAGLREPDEVEEDLDARVFGNFLHNIMDWFYHDLMEQKQTAMITADDLLAENLGTALAPLVDRAFHQHYNLDPQRKIEYVGQRVVVRAIVLRFAQKILALDRAYAPFNIELLEEKKFRAPVEIDNQNRKINVMIGGRIDRVDSKDGVFRVVDYKTGKDEITFESIESLFARQGKRNKSAFQTILYAWLYKQNVKSAQVIQPLLMNRKNIFEKDGVKTFSMNKVPVLDITPDLPQFQRLLQELLEELFDPAVAFNQTEDERNCLYCPFKNMCRR